MTFGHRLATTGCLLTGLLSCVLAVPGCAGTSPSRDPATQAAVNPNGGGSQRPLQPTNHGFAGPPRKSWTDGIQRASHDLAEALTIKPKVIPADDPVSLSSEPENVGVELYLQMARHFEQSGQLTAAARQYSKALEAEPENVSVLVSAARLQDRADQLERALELYHRAVQAAPDDPLVRNDLGLCYARHDRLPEAVEQLRHAVRRAPDRPRYRNNLATALVQSGRPGEAWQHLQAVHAEPVAHYNLAFLLDRFGQPEAARRHYLLAIRQDPRLATAAEQVAGRDAAGPVR